MEWLPIAWPASGLHLLRIRLDPEAAEEEGRLHVIAFQRFQYERGLIVIPRGVYREGYLFIAPCHRIDGKLPVKPREHLLLVSFGRRKQPLRRYGYRGCGLPALRRGGGGLFTPFRGGEYAYQHRCQYSRQYAGGCDIEGFSCYHKYLHRFSSNFGSLNYMRRKSAIKLNPSSFLCWG